MTIEAKGSWNLFFATSRAVRQARRAQAKPCGRPASTATVETSISCFGKDYDDGFEGLGVDGEVSGIYWERGRLVRTFVADKRKELPQRGTENTKEILALPIKSAIDTGVRFSFFRVVSCNFVVFVL